MPRTRSLAWSELKIGVLTIAAFVIAAMTIFLVTGGQGFPWQRYGLKTRFPNVAGLKPGSPVRVAGVEVGSVGDVAFAGAQVDVTMSVNQSVHDRITTASTATLGSVSLLGESAVDIIPATTGTPIPEWGYVPTGRPLAQLSDVATQASQGVAEITKLVHDLREGRGTAGELLTDDQLYVQLRQFVTTAADLTRGIREGRGTLGRLMNDPATAQALQATLTNLETITGQIGAGQGSLGKLLKDEAFARSLTATTTNLQTLTDRLNHGEGTMGRLMTDRQLYDRLDSVTGRFDQLLARLNDGQGTAGQLLKDRQLYENMNGAVADLRSLVADIRQDPKKFLRVKVSIF